MVSRGRAVRIVGKGGVEVLKLDSCDIPSPGPGQALVEVCAAGLNRADILQRRGFYPAPAGVPADVPGLEFAGTIVAVGDGVDSRVGDPVMGIVGGGAMATHLVVHHRELVPVPKGMDLVDAAAIPEVFMTAFDALFDQGGLLAGESVLIHSAGSGVGTAAIQLARHAGATVHGTSRSADKLERCRALGLSHGHQVSDKGFATAVKAVARRGGIDLIIDTVGAAYLGENISALSERGRLVVLGLLGGVKGDLNLGAVLAKRLTIRGSVLRARPLEEKIALAQAFTRRVLPLFESGLIAPVIDERFSMEQVAQAHSRMESNTTFGKVVLHW